MIDQAPQRRPVIRGALGTARTLCRWWQTIYSWRRRLLATAGMLGFFWLWWSGVPLLYEGAVGVSGGERLKAVTDTRTALLAALAAVGALGTFWLNSRNHRITARTFEVTERGHFTDRYAKAIEHLGSDSVDVRLGGIYALEQIANDSPRDRDQATIVEVLCAFVRVHSDPLHQYMEANPGVNPLDAPPPKIQEFVTEYVNGLDRPPVDVQAAVTVLGRLPIRPESHFVRVDLVGAYLRKANLVGVNFSGALLVRADLTSANFQQANLAEANLLRADLTNASFLEADLTRATLEAAKLNSALLLRATLSEASLEDADLTGANLTGADLSKAHLDEANLKQTVIRAADLSGACNDVTQDQLDVSWGDRHTRIPEGLKRPSAWDKPQRWRLGTYSS